MKWDSALSKNVDKNETPMSANYSSFWLTLTRFFSDAEGYSEPNQVFKMDLFAKMANG